RTSGVATAPPPLQARAQGLSEAKRRLPRSRTDTRLAASHSWWWHSPPAGRPSRSCRGAVCNSQRIPSPFLQPCCRRKSGDREDLLLVQRLLLEECGGERVQLLAMLHQQLARAIVTLVDDL